ncbi:hypothetical protein NQ318_008983, partial [Aromia moschata]
MDNWMHFFSDVTCFSFGNPPTFERVMKRMNLLSNAFFWYIVPGVITIAIVNYTATDDCRKINQEEGLHELCGSFLPIRLPFDANPLVIRVTIFLVQMVVFFFTVVPGGLICYISYESTEILLTHNSLLKVLLVEAFETQNVEESSERLRFCIIYHNHIIRLCQRLNRLVKFTAGHMTLISAIVFACMGNQILKTKPVAALAYLIGYIFALFWMCHAGQRIIDEVFLLDREPTSLADPMD